MNASALLQLRARAAERVPAMQAGQITWDDFVDEFGDLKDPPIAKLVDLVEHEPQRGGMLGVRESHYQEYLDRVREAIEELELAARAAQSQL